MKDGAVVESNTNKYYKNVTCQYLINCLNTLITTPFSEEEYQQFLYDILELLKQIDIKNLVVIETAIAQKSAVSVDELKMYLELTTNTLKQLSENKMEDTTPQEHSKKKKSKVFLSREDSWNMIEDKLNEYSCQAQSKVFLSRENSWNMIEKRLNEYSCQVQTQTQTQTKTQTETQTHQNQNKSLKNHKILTKRSPEKNLQKILGQTNVVDKPKIDLKLKRPAKKLNANQSEPQTQHLVLPSNSDPRPILKRQLSQTKFQIEKKAPISVNPARHSMPFTRAQADELHLAFSKMSLQDNAAYTKMLETTKRNKKDKQEKKSHSDQRPENKKKLR
ncbi:MAG: hypothetical protein JSS07_03630 [Proteobacteria bacterium]|nr:hypothetical protein [Pseudomonadota bacterium]